MAVIAVAQRKGGAGKTTLAAQLGVAFAAGGRKVAMLDVDPQGSLTAWGQARAEAGRGAPPVIAVSGWRLSTEIDRLKREFDLLIVDTPPHADTDARVAIRAAEFVLIPVQASPMDLWAIGPTIELARAERRPTLLVLNRLASRGKLIEVARERIRKMDVPVAAASLGNRTAFAASMMDGAGVVETHAGSPAADEIAALVAEIGPRLKVPA